MKRLRIGWGIFCAICDIALTVFVCMEWSKTGSAWWSLVLAGVFYTIGCINVWKFFDDLFKKAQSNDKKNIYYKEEWDD